MVIGVQFLAFCGITRCAILRSISWFGESIQACGPLCSPLAGSRPIMLAPVPQVLFDFELVPAKGPCANFGVVAIWGGFAWVAVIVLIVGISNWRCKGRNDKTYGH